MSSQESTRALLFDGVLYNRKDLIAELGRTTAALNDADLLLVAYDKWGLELPRHVKGIYAMAIGDSEQERVVAVRDPLGAYPLFFSEVSERILFSTSIDALRRQPGIGSTVNRAALADHVLHRWPNSHETFFAGIRRVPPGHMLRTSAGHVVVERYWDPAPSNRPVEWVTEDQLGLFDVLLDQAVERTASRGRTGIFLSGGLDSISVAAIATDLARTTGRQAPLALSLGFPGDCSEEIEQKGVAAALGLEQEFVPFEEAAPSAELLRSALDITRIQPAPLLNAWAPAYCELTRRGKQLGVEVVLSGAGGDEWLSITPYLAADLIRAREMKRLWKLVSGWQRSYQLSPARAARVLMWTYGAKPLASGFLERLSPQRWRARRVGKTVRSRVAWVAPGAALQRELADRVSAWMPNANPSDSYYLSDVRLSLDHPLTSMELEEIFEMDRRLNVRMLHPYWDADLVDLLYRTPPELAIADGRAKSLVRGTMARRFPNLGLDRQKKRAGTLFYRSVLMQGLPALWRESPDLSALADLGIVEPQVAAAMIERTIAPGYREGLRRVWDLINVEAWVKAHS